MVLRGKPTLLVNLYLDDGTIHVARKTTTFNNILFQKRVLTVSTVERSVAFPPGPLQVDNVEITLEDIDNQVKSWFDAITPLRRIAEIVFDFEQTLASDLRDFPISASSYVETPVPLFSSALAWNTLFKGSIVKFSFPPGQAIIQVKEIVSTWLDREIPRLIIRDNFPNLPDDANESADNYTAPIIFGRVQSFNRVNIENQGVIRCWHVDTTLNWYCLARHYCYQVYAVYRKRPGDHKFTRVSPTEYNVVHPTININGIDYVFTMIQMIVKQKDGTIIHADASGINYRWDFTVGLFVTGIETRSPVDALVSLILFLQEEAQPPNFDGPSFVAAYNRANALGLLCDGAITHAMTNGEAISSLSSEHMMDVYQSNQALIAVKIFDPTDLSGAIPINKSLTLVKTVEPRSPDLVYNRVRYRYFRQNAGLTEYTLNSATGQYGAEEVVDNVPDQDELSNTGQNPLLELKKNFDFVRDDAVCLFLVKRLLGHYTLRSYHVDFEVPMPEVVRYLNLITSIALTHRNGIGLTGWTNYIMKVYGITFNPHTYTAIVRAARVVVIPDDSFMSSYLGFHDAHDPQKRNPQLPVYVNGSVDGFGDTDPAADHSINLSDNFPPAPDIGGDSVPVNVNWQEDRSSGIGQPRNTSGYVMVPNGRRQVRFYTGTLSPDTRPGGLTDTDIYKVIFYSTDFNHEYWWVGTGETGTPSGWKAIEDTARKIALCFEAPVGPWWHVCNGSVVNASDYKGSVAAITLPVASGMLLLGSPASDAIASVDLTDNTSLPVCLGATPIEFDRVRLMPYMRL